MKHHSLTLVLLLTLFIHTNLPCAATGNNANHSKWLQLPTAQLQSMALSDFSNGGRKDTAMLCFTIIGNRYDKSMTIKAKEECIDAFMKLWAIYYYDFYDYPKCFDCLSQAQEIASESNIKNANIFIGFGCMYQTISEECNNYELGSKALSYYKKALKIGIETADYTHTDMACTDVLSMAHSQHGLVTIKREWNEYVKLDGASKSSILRVYNTLLHKAFTAIENKRPSDAISIFDQQLDLIDTTQYSRLIYFTCIEKAKAFALMGDYNRAIATLHRPEQIAIDLNMKDCQLEVFGMLARFYQATGNTSTQATYREKYTALKDTLNNYHQLASVSEVEFRNELKGMEHEITQVKHHREIMSIVSLVSLSFLAVVLTLLYFVFKKNRQLKRSNRSLYLKNVQMLKAEEEERNRRRQQNASTITTQQQQPQDDVKYKHSHLRDDDKSVLFSCIIDIMESNDEIFSADFSLERLAVLCNSKYKYVSQVIHENSNQNFNSFLNSFRIKEACKRMSDIENYGNLTIEAISASVGFKSRSTFVSSFKKITGLTPSQYQRIAREETKK